MAASACIPSPFAGPFQCVEYLGFFLDIEKKYLESSTTGLTRGARKLMDNKGVNLRERANLLSSVVFDRLTREKSTLAVRL